MNLFKRTLVLNQFSIFFVLQLFSIHEFLIFSTDYVNLQKCVPAQMIQHLDRFALTHLLSGKKSSWIGLCGTLLLLGVCLAIYVPAILSYFKGNYYQSQYMTYKNHTGYIYFNYAKQNNLSSFEQRAILAAKEARVNIREVFDGKFLAKTFGLEEDNRTARLNDMRETMGSFNSYSVGSFWPSVGEPSVNLE